MTGTADTYRTLTLNQLLEILEHAHEHRPEAVVAAWAELEYRGVSKYDILERRRWLARDTEAHRIAPRPWVLDRPAAPRLAGPPVQWGGLSLRTEWIMNAVRVLVSLIALLQVYGLFTSGLFMLRPDDRVSPLTVYIMLLSCAAAVFCIVASLRLWQVRRVGWMMAAAILLFQFLTPMFEVIRYSLFGTANLFVAQFERVHLHGALLQLGVGTLLYVPALYFLLLPRVRAPYRIDEAAAIRTLLIAAAVLLLTKLITYGW